MHGFALFAAGAVIAGVGMACLPQIAGEGKEGETRPEASFVSVTGTSKEGSFEGALASALREASARVNREGADRIVEWEMEKVSGRYGGFAGFREVSVTIRFPGEGR